MLSTAQVFFHGALNDFLPASKRNRWISYSFNGTPGAKDAIEAIGVPHPEVDIISINQVPATFSTLLKNNDTIEVYPANFNQFPSSCSLTQPPPNPPFFILDVHLGSLARVLRLLGFDTLYQNDYEDQQIATIASSEDRIVLTRDIGLLKIGSVKWGYWLRSQHTEEQLKEVTDRYQLMQFLKPFNRCMVCNGILIAVEKEVVLHQLPPRTKEHFSEFHQCSSCNKIYWKGSHYAKMLALIERIKK